MAITNMNKLGSVLFNHPAMRKLHSTYYIQNQLISTLSSLLPRVLLLFNTVRYPQKNWQKQQAKIMVDIKREDIRYLKYWSFLVINFMSDLLWSFNRPKNWARNTGERAARTSLWATKTSPSISKQTSALFPLSSNSPNCWHSYIPRSGNLRGRFNDANITMNQKAIIFEVIRRV